MEIEFLKTQVFTFCFYENMSREQMLNLLHDLARSQGCWGRLLRDIYELDEETRENFFTERESMNFKSWLDFILFLEWNA